MNGARGQRCLVSVLVIVTALGVLGFEALAPSRAAAAGAPVWKATMELLPTRVKSGMTPEGAVGVSYALYPRYDIVVTNIGSAPSEGVIEVRAHISAGAVPVEPRSRSLTGTLTTGSPCSVLPEEVRCIFAEPVRSTGSIQVAIPVEIAAAEGASLSAGAVVTGGGAAEATASTTAVVGVGPAPFGFNPGEAGLSGSVISEEGEPMTAAGGHPAQLTIDAAFPSKIGREGSLVSIVNSGHPRDIVIRLPKGMVVNPQATPTRCTEAQLEAGEGKGQACPNSSAVGVIGVKTTVGGALPIYTPIYNMVPPKGRPAELGFDAAGIGIYVHIFGEVNSEGGYELSARSSDTLAKNTLLSFQAQIWGNPADPSHDEARGECAVSDKPDKCPVAPEPTAFVTMPTSCSPQLSLQAAANSWEDPLLLTASALFTTSVGAATGTSDCGGLQFGPTIRSQPTAGTADSATGLDFLIHQPQDQLLSGRSTSALKDVAVALPQGMTLNPAAANGLASCSVDQIGLLPGTGGNGTHFNDTPQTCPDSAKIGTVEVFTPLLSHALPGSVYVAKPFANPFNSLIAAYIAVEDEQSGIIAKLAGSVESNSTTGQLTAHFVENPELPLEDIAVHFFPGDRAALTTPFACGRYVTTSRLTPWATPDVSDAVPSDAFEISTAADGRSSCPSSEAAAPNAPAFQAGTETPKAGSFSPFVLKLARPDGSQHLTGLDVNLPEGLTGKLAGIPYCPEAGIARAQARSNPEEGKLEQSDPSCPASAEVGTVTVGAGSGSSPLSVIGHAFLAGPYKGAPLSMAIITPAVAGPFDLGVVVVRVALQVNLETAQIHAVSDPLPTILQGIPLDLRSVAVRLGRPGFTLNPTDCEPTAVGAQVTTATGQIASLSSRFQVGGCTSLAFKPKLKISLKGPTKRAAHPTLRAEVKMPQGGANIARAQVSLPPSEFLDQGNLDNVCVQADLKAGTCPASSVYGKAKAWTPLLDAPLEGPVYLGVGYGHQLPDLVADLNGQIRVLVHGKIDTTKQHGLRNTFEVVPDAPLSRFVLEMKGGKRYGLLTNSEDVCRKTQRASARFVAQNGKVAQLRPRIANTCNGKKKRGKRRH